jgi:uncharacterized protein (TIGR03086 family)
MTDNRATAAHIGGTALLERAINYTLGSLHAVTPEALAYPTPCRNWDLLALLRHMYDSLLALHEAIDVGRVDLDMPDSAGPAADQADEPAASLRNLACRVLGAWTNADRQTISIAGCPVTTALVTGAGAIELTMHGWDVARACGQRRPIPRSLAEEMLDLSPFLVTDADRPTHFAPPVDLPPLAGPSDRLIAFLGRNPHQPPG